MEKLTVGARLARADARKKEVWCQGIIDERKQMPQRDKGDGRVDELYTRIKNNFSAVAEGDEEAIMQYAMKKYGYFIELVKTGNQQFISTGGARAEAGRWQSILEMSKPQIKE